MHCASLMRARDVMTRTLVTCHDSETLVGAAKTMAQYEVGALVVLDANGALVGIVTDRDLCLALADDDRTRTVRSIMAPVVIWVRPGQTIEQVEALMAKHRVHRVPVVDSDRVPIGIISLGDLAVGACKAGDSRDRVAVTRTLAEIHGSRV